MTKVLVVGANSFSGAHFVKYAQAQGAAVETGSLRVWNLPQWNCTADYVVNFSALNVVAPSWDYPVDYLRANVTRTTELLDYLRRCGQITRYLHVSTPEVYGATRGKIGEDAPYNPSTPYAVSRAAAEMMCRVYHQQHRLPVVITRACNVYGPGQQLYRLIPKVIASIKADVKFPLEGGGQSHRAFVHVDDLCSALWTVMTKGEPPLAYHISTPYLWRIRDLVAFIAHRMGRKFTDVVELTEERPGKDDVYALDILRLRALGWREQVKIEEGIDGMITWVNNNWAELQAQPQEYQIDL